MDHRPKNHAGLEGFWRRQALTIDWLVLGAGWLGAILLLLFHEPPGWAVGVLAAVAAIMTFSKPSAWQRVAVIGLAGTLFFLEARSITEDRIAQDKLAASSLSKILRENRDETRSIINDNRQKTAEILSDSQSRFSSTEKYFVNIISRDEKIKSLSADNLDKTKETLDSLNGSNSFAYVVPITAPNDALGLMARNSGKYTITGLSILLYGLKYPPVTLQQYDLGVLAGRDARLMLPGIHPDASRGINSYSILINEQNGTYQETLDVRRAQKPGKEWETRFIVRKWILDNQVIGNEPVELKIVLQRDWSSDDVMPTLNK